jgi:hypothetical protein
MRKSGEAWRIRCSSRFLSMGASDTGESSWRQLQERAEKIPGDKKHVERMLSQSHCVALLNTAHKFLAAAAKSPISRITGH